MSTNRLFKYYKTTNRIIEEGNSKADLASKASLEFDEYGNILRSNRSWNKSYIVYKYDYHIPIESVYSDIHDFYHNFKKSELAVYGLKMTTEKRKISHAISSETTYELKGNRYIATNQKKYYYSNK